MDACRQFIIRKFLLTVSFSSPVLILRYYHHRTKITTMVQKSLSWKRWLMPWKFPRLLHGWLCLKYRRIQPGNHQCQPKLLEVKLITKGPSLVAFRVPKPTCQRKQYWRGSIRSGKLVLISWGISFLPNGAVELAQGSDASRIIHWKSEYKHWSS